MNNTIEKDFFELTGKGKICSFSGRQKGENLRDKWELDKLEQDANTHVLIKVPETVYNLGPSFLQGLFTKTIFKENGLQIFHNKYTFKASSIIKDQIDFVVDKLNRDKEKGKTIND